MCAAEILIDKPETRAFTLSLTLWDPREYTEGDVRAGGRAA